MNPIFLNDEKILSWQKPAKKEVYTIVTVGTGSTIIIEYKGLEEVKKELNKYYIIASSVKYLAEIKRLEDNGILTYSSFEGNSSPMEGSRTELLFQGNLTVYSKGVISGTTILGEEIKLSEMINFAILDTNQTLDSIITEENIEKIILGYELQEQELK
jgi:hypothetical protein